MFRRRRKTNRRRAPAKTAPRAARATQPRGASRSKRPRRFSVRPRHYLETAWLALRRLLAAPAAAAMTVLAIGIALALPATLYVAVKNLQQVSEGWGDSAQISLFLRQDMSAQDIRGTRAHIEAMNGVRDVRHMTSGAALQEFQSLSGLEDLDEVLAGNPFPEVLLVVPEADYATPVGVAPLLHQLRALPQVELAQLDMAWLERWHALMTLGQRAVWLLAVLLALGVVLVVGNTIRLAVQNRRDEIAVQKLIGATDRFIRRPFLYGGGWYGVCGAVVAWLLVYMAVMALQGPVLRLVQLYGSSYRVEALGIGGALLLLVAGGMLGLAGARLAVGRHLRDIEPD